MSDISRRGQRFRVPQAEAEETVDAIYRGAVDAVVVESSEGPQIVTLSGADLPYRLLADRMSEGAITAGPDGTIFYCNRRLTELTGFPPEAMVGQPLHSLFVDLGAGERLRDVIEAGASAEHEMSIRRADGTAFPALVWISPVSIEGLSAQLITLTDLRPRKTSEALVAAERFTRSILEQATAATVVCDADGRITHVSDMADTLAGRPVIGWRFADAYPVSLEDGADGLPGAEEANLAVALLAGARFRGLDVRLSDPRLEDRYFLLTGGPLQAAGGAVVGCVISLTEITERKRAERQQTMLVAELNHRVKNILAIVRSVAMQTLVASPSLENFKGAFDGRLKALSLAHDILTRVRWGRVELGALIGQCLAPYRDLGGRDRVYLDGSATLLPPLAVVPLAMVFHELATNAAKYGCLAKDGARLDVGWSLIETGAHPEVRIEWRESGITAVASPARGGFGTRLIKRVLSYDLNGTVDFEFAGCGLRCVLNFPVPAEYALLEAPTSL